MEKFQNVGIFDAGVWLLSRGVTVEGEKLDALIESAVYDLKNGVMALTAEV